jgi:hypothetical protein
MCAIGPGIALIQIKEACMAMDIGFEESNVDHFLISTRENQFILIFIDQAEVMKEALSIWED